ncbi:xanthine dehydrogenase subunit XdhA [Schaedlerella sp.]|jgi:xanthine dehydrogenase molybdenum-binding subunit|uniref:xanthine dehydrogenase subunit XdhA n=1 Tax=Schaedlerella sp. TaxID=2676057 RepID=UPI001362973F|nr:xanthine dehydrogenase subunit XdhA [uncultured Schaedlerella sp.]MCI8766206.1 xanthine dehydrogenase molybdenum-binding subunit XdhA [Ruminococcus sp.]NBI98770.1 xanthine dehydrogenase molybdenum-binding subunit XdhA [Lachnospiraceae bacterium]
MYVGKKVTRVDAYDKVIGRTKYTDDLCDKSAYIAQVLHSTIAHGRVVSIDTSEAEKIPGVIRVFTCFDVKEKHYFPTAGHPWSTDPGHQDVADRLVLTEEVRFYGDDIAAVVAEDEVSAAQAIRAIKVEYEEYPFVLDVQEAMKDGAPQIHEKYPNNILKHTTIRKGNYEEAIQEPGLTRVEGWYETPTVQHCHIENFICYAEMEGERITVVASTQIPHIVRRVVGQALGIGWGQVRIIKPYIGGGFGNKQDILYEPLCAWLCMQVGGHLVKLDVPREDTFVSNRVRHSIRSHIISWVRPDGTYAARKLEAFSDQGAYASHGHSIVAKGAGAFPQLYPCDNVEVDAYTIFTNKSVAGAMRGYGIPQAMWAVECHTEDVAAKMGMDPLEFRRKNLMPVGYMDPFSKNELYSDTFNQCLDKAMEAIDYERKFKEYQNQTGDIRRGIGMSVFWYNTAVWPISLETSSCRMVLNQDGSLQVQLGETEIGQGADTAYTQMTADVLGVPLESVHVVSCQDTDVTPFGTGAYASRQTYTAGFAIRQTALLLRERILKYAQELTRMPPYNLDIVDGNIVRTTDGRELMTLGELATEALYSLTNSQHLSAESTSQIKSNAYSFGCTMAEVEVDIPMCRVKLLDIVNVHDAGKLINPALAEAQVHGGMSMGIGFGLSERLMFDPKTGRALNNNLLDYKLSTFMDHPRLKALFVENPEPTSAFGTKALGEPPTCSVAPAIRNAVYQATGVGVNEAPVNPHNLFRRFTEEGIFESEGR